RDAAVGRAGPRRGAEDHPPEAALPGLRRAPLRAPRPAPRRRRARDRGLRAAVRAPLPARPLQVHPASAIEADPFAREEIALHLGPESVTMAAAPGGADDTLPGHDVEERPAERAERHADGPRGARPAEDGGDLPVRHHLPARYT